ncbi:hypothetical protein [Janthinobacterium sp. RB2R34]|uniref:hypothetical protein n=1 Tax=Janthinobacterium sp. RB2R34 TaxID=3424193 RepID=UPI003F23FD9A
MQGSNTHRHADLAALAFAVILVPAVHIALMYWEYQLHLPLSRQVDTFLVLLALVLAVLAASYFPPSWMKKVLRVIAVVVWSCLAYFVSSFMPGCIWAPACL